MRILRHVVAGLSCVGLLVIAFPAPAHADAFDEQTFLTFSGPVELPGVSLPGGTYMFKLADPDDSRDIVQVFNQDGTVCYGTFLTTPEVEPMASGRPAVTFEKRAADAPQAIKSWFYAGDETGREFAYGYDQEPAGRH